MSEQVRDVGVSILERVRGAVSPECYQTWFKDLSVREVAGGVARFAAPNRFVKQWLESHYRKELLRSAAAVRPEVHNVELLVAPLPAADGATALANVLADAVPALADAGTAQRLTEDRGAGRDTLRLAPLSAKFRLESFVVGKSNRLAHVAAQSIVESPGRVYNPLFLHGVHGVGKTHLLQGIAHLLRERTPPLTVIYLSCEEFTNAYIWAVQNRRLDAFRARFRNCDVLLVDDVQFFAGREKTQEEFLHTFDVLRNANKQVVLCANAAPRDIKRLDPRLVTRFHSELVARLEAPEPALRVRLLCEKARARGADLAQDVAELLAAHIENNVRELEGAVCKLMALAAARHDDSLRSPLAPPGTGAQTDARLVPSGPPEGTARGEGRTLFKPDRELALVALRELGYLHSGPVALPDILEAASRHFGASADDVRSGKRHAALVHARHVAMYLSKLLTAKGLSDIGRFYGNRDHASVLHACRKIGELLKRDENLQHDIHALRQVLGR